MFSGWKCQVHVVSHGDSCPRVDPLLQQSPSAHSQNSLTLLMYLCNEPKIDEATQEPENCKDTTAWGQ